jgi:hypothetical protein
MGLTSTFSCAIFYLQVLLFGGLAYSPANLTVSRSTDLFVLDFTAAVPRWRRAPVANINTQGADKLAFPNAGVVPLPALGLMALQHRSVSDLMMQAAAAVVVAAAAAAVVAGAAAAAAAAGVVC